MKQQEDKKPKAPVKAPKVACTNCDDSGKACSVCHAGDIVE